MKKLLLLSTLLFASPSFAQTQKPPFSFDTLCALETKDEYLMDVCVVSETRDSSGLLQTRTIVSNRFNLTINGRVDKEKGYVQWDNRSKTEYKWNNKINDKVDGDVWIYVMPGFVVKKLSAYE